MAHSPAPSDADLLALAMPAFGDAELIGRRPHAYRSSFAVEEIDLRTPDGGTHRLLFKDLAWAGLTPEARAAKPDILYNPSREIEVYRHVLSPRKIGASLRGSVLDTAADVHWLLLDRVCGTELSQSGDIAVWQSAARWLAQFHSSFAEPAPESLPASVLVHDAGFYKAWLQRAIDFTPDDGTAEALERRGVLSRIAAAHDRIIQRLLAQPRSLLHGEFYATNVLVQTAAGRTSILPVDWEDAAIGPRLTDLAALVAGRWDDEARLAMVSAYHDALPPTLRISLSSTMGDLTWCRLQLALQWLGWARSWEPPPEKRHQWLEEARQLLDDLEIG